MKASSISSCADDEETEKTISNKSKLTRSKYKSKQKKNSVASSDAKKFTNFRRKYLARPIKYSVSSVFKYDVGALSSLFNIRIDNVFCIEDYNKEILKEATLKGIADCIKSGKAKKYYCSNRCWYFYQCRYSRFSFLQNWSLFKFKEI